MGSTNPESTALSAAQARVITVKTESDDIVKYSGNPAELAGARHETYEAMRRAGVFQLLTQHGASRAKGGAICVANLNDIAFVTQLVKDPMQNTYSLENPCPDTQTRMDQLNAERAAAGLPIYSGINSIAEVPDKLLKLAMPNEDEVRTEALAMALTMLSIFEDRHHANELLRRCQYDGRKLGPLLDEIEAQSTEEDITLVTSRRDKFKDTGLSGMTLNFSSFRAFWKQFNVLEYRCPPGHRLDDRQKMQMVNKLFICDPSFRKNWSDHINAPVIRNALGQRVSGPPQDYTEAKLLAEKVLRSGLVLSGIDELSSPTQPTLLTEALAAANTSSTSGGVTAQQLYESLLSDPRKTFNTGGSVSMPSFSSASSEKSSGGEWQPINVPKGEDGKYKYWAPPMKPCDCGTPDEGYHIKGKWPCAYYRNPNKDKEASPGSLLYGPIQPLLLFVCVST